MTSETDELLIAWQGRTSGPFPLGEILDMLKQRRINSLYKVQRDGEWVLLRDYLGEREKSRREAQAAEEKAAAARVATPMAPRVVPEDEGEAADGSREMEFESLADAREEGDGRVFAVTSFVLSLLFMVPFFNILAWAGSLVFGHIAQSRQRDYPAARGRQLAWCGLWFSYLFGGFFLISFISLGLALDGPLDDGMTDFLIVLHTSMIMVAAVGAFNAGLVTLGVKVMKGRRPLFAQAAVAGLFSTVVYFTLQFVVVIRVTESVADDGRFGFWILAVNALLPFFTQALIWGEMVRVKDRDKLGFGNACMISLFSIVISAFLYFVVFAVASALE